MKNMVYFSFTLCLVCTTLLTISGKFLPGFFFHHMMKITQGLNFWLAIKGSRFGFVELEYLPGAYFEISFLLYNPERFYKQKVDEFAVEMVKI